MSAVAMLEALAAAPKPFYVFGLWRHEDGSLERKQYRAPMARMTQAQTEARGLGRYIGKPEKTLEGAIVVLEAVEIEERVV